MTELHTPNNKLIEEYIDKFNKDERYYLADQAIIKLFQKFPENKHLEDILLKISVINDLYSTNIFATFIMAKHIQLLDIDDELQKGNPGIVRKIALGHNIRAKKTEREINFYSFATKYCNWHNKDSYPIYDSFVEKILIAYRNKDKFSKFENKELKNFERFKEIITDFKHNYNLASYNLKEIDKFLWIYGKTVFPNSYGQK